MSCLMRLDSELTDSVERSAGGALDAELSERWQEMGDTAKSQRTIRYRR